MTFTDFTRRGGGRAGVLAGLLAGAIVASCTPQQSVQPGNSNGQPAGSSLSADSSATTGGAGRTNATDSGGVFAPETGGGGPGGSSHFNTNANANSSGEMPTFSFFSQFQVDPADEDSAGPKFLASGDIDNDGLLDLASGWNESQPVQIHLQRRDTAGNVRFETITLAGTFPVTTMGGLRLGDINGDGWLDVVVAIKNMGVAIACDTPFPPPPNAICDADPCDPGCTTAMCDPLCGGDPCAVGCTALQEIEGDLGEIVLLLSPGDVTLLRNGDNWTEVELINSRLKGRRDLPVEIEPTEPEFNSYTDLELGEIDGAPGLDIIVAFNPAECECDGEKPPHNRVDLYPNPGPGLIATSSAWSPVRLEDDAPAVKDTALVDIDGDGDLDVVVTYPDAISRNVRWIRNPLIPHTPGGVGGTAQVLMGMSAWEHRPIGQIAIRADVLAIGDIDFDGHDDVLVRATSGVGPLDQAVGGTVQWFRNPNVPEREPITPPNPVPIRDDFPWQVYVLADFVDRVPEGVAVGDLNGDGQVEAAVGIEGALVWFDSIVAGSAYAEWVESPIIRDSAPDDPNAAPGAPDTSTFINNVLIVDLDGDGFNDVVGTLDRREGNGLNRDIMVWYRNNLSRR